VLLTPHCSLFQVAVLNNHEQLVQLLLDKGADPSVKNEVNKLYWRFSFGGEYNTRI
jgi:ankyrin repeat protein